jgi:hypothetical protein
MAKMLDMQRTAVLKYAKSLVGVQYLWWHDSETTLSRNEPFYVSLGKPPSLKYIRAHGCNCAGLFNLIYRKFGKGGAIPGLAEGNEYAGGTQIWYDTLKHSAEVFDSSKIYPAGTMLIRPYINVHDQGHVAMIYKSSERGVLYSALVHCYSSSVYNPECKLPVGPGVAINKNVGFSHFWIADGLYTHAVLFEHWFAAAS